MGFNNGVGVELRVPGKGLVHPVTELCKEGEIGVLEVVGDVLYEVLFVVGDADEEEEAPLDGDDGCGGCFDISNLRL